MKSLLYSIFLATIVPALAEDPVVLRYHENIGIPLAERIRQAEQAINFDGSRITGGSPAPLGAYPYLVGQLNHLSDGRTSVCGSSMLSNTVTVTAAHCWSDGWAQAVQLTLVFGTTTLFSGGVRVTTRNVQMHQNWNTNTLANDIAVVYFNWVPYSNVIQPLSLPSGSLLNNNFVGVWAQASGYGMTGDGSQHAISPNQVQSHVNLRVISNAECRETFGNFILDTTICTSGAEGGNICSSDSGGPLSIRNGNDRVLIGVVSFGSGLGCQTRRPGAYARVTSYAAWLRSRL